MKITKSKLKQIIKEEMGIVSEDDAMGHYEPESWPQKAMRLLSQIYSNTTEEWPQEARDSFSELQEMLTQMEDEELNK